MISQFAKELDTQQAVQRHEEQEEQGDIVNLLTGTPVLRKSTRVVKYSVK